MLAVSKVAVHTEERGRRPLASCPHFVLDIHQDGARMQASLSHCSESYKVSVCRASAWQAVLVFGMIRLGGHLLGPSEGPSRELTSPGVTLFYLCMTVLPLHAAHPSPLPPSFRGGCLT